MPSLPLPHAVPRRERLRLAGGLAALCALYATAHLSHLDPRRLSSTEGLRSVWDLLHGFLKPDLSADFLLRVLTLIGESFAIGFVGLALALVIGVPLSLVAARLPQLCDGPRPHSWQEMVILGARPAARGFLSVLRSVPEIIWAFLFVRILGLGPGPAVLAIGLTFGGIIGKLFSELIESCPPEAGRSLRAAGTSPLGVALYGVLPQIRHQWVGYALFRLECAIRSASILGVVGAGGIGAEIDLSIRYFQYDKLATALLAVLACVVVLELLSLVLRRRHAGISAGFLVSGTVMGLMSLHIGWDRLISPHALTQLLTFLGAFARPQWDTPFLLDVTFQMMETVCMATAGTSLAAVIAFMLAPLATRQLSLSGYLRHSPSLKGARTRLSGGLLLTAARALFQITRALPELVWALLFVMWVGPGPMAGTLAIAAHTVGVLGRLFGEVYEDIEPSLPQAVEGRGASRVAVWGYGVLPQALRSLQSYTLFRFEVNIRSTAMVGFVGAGGIGNSIHTAISLFHFRELASMLLILMMTVVLVDTLSGALRRRLLQR